MSGGFVRCSIESLYSLSGLNANAGGERAPAYGITPTSRMRRSVGRPSPSWVCSTAGRLSAVSSLPVPTAPVYINCVRVYLRLTQSGLPNTGSKTAQPLITQTELGSVRLPHPPLPEQWAIAELLGGWTTWWHGDEKS